MPPKKVFKNAKSTLDIYETIIVTDKVFSKTLSFDNTSLFTKDLNNTEKAK
jgi:hypothetical protein